MNDDDDDDDQQQQQQQQQPKPPPIKKIRYAQELIVPPHPVSSQTIMQDYARDVEHELDYFDNYLPGDERGENENFSLTEHHHQGGKTEAIDNIVNHRDTRQYYKNIARIALKNEKIAHSMIRATEENFQRDMRMDAFIQSQLDYETTMMHIYRQEYLYAKAMLHRHLAKKFNKNLYYNSDELEFRKTLKFESESD